MSFFEKFCLIFTVACIAGFVACSAIRYKLNPPDHNYGARQEVAYSLSQNSQDSIDYFFGCSVTCIGQKNGKTYAATAGHCNAPLYGGRNRNYVTLTPHAQYMYPVSNMWCDTERDICIMEIDGKLPYIQNLLKDKPNNDTDIIVGFVDGNKVITQGYAIPGQSGGGVFTRNGELWGVVSTTHQGVSIYPALKRLNLLWILE